MMHRLFMTAICLVGSVPASPLAQAADDKGDFAAHAAPLLRRFCVECHGHEGAEAGLDFERLLAVPDFAVRFKTWEKVNAVLSDKRMPPEDTAQPSDGQRSELGALIRDRIDAVARDQAGDPGRIVMRRLTSAEYAYAIRDLTGLDLPLERTLVGDAVGGEGFTNVGEVQFIEDAILERYLEAAKIVAAHAVIGAGPLEFFQHPGKTGLELSAIDRIQKICRAHGFRTGAAEGGEPYGLHRYPRAFFVAWRFHHRHKLGLEDASLADLADEEGLAVRFVQHILNVVNQPAPSFPTSEIVAAWRKLPVPTGPDANLRKSVGAQCQALYESMRDRQSLLAAAAGADEEVALLTNGTLNVLSTHSFKADIDWTPGAEKASVRFAVASATRTGADNAVVIWRKPLVRFVRAEGGQMDQQAFVGILSEKLRKEVAFGSHPKGGQIGAEDFVITGASELALEFRVPEGTKGLELLVKAELDVEHGEDCVVRCTITDGSTGRRTAADTGAVSTLLADPGGAAFASWKQGVLEFALDLPDVSHREPAPSDRDPIPAPYDNTYNNAERNDFHYQIKYHRGDRFLVEHLLDDATRQRLDQAWVDLLSSFEYHDAFLRFVAEKYDLDLGDRGVADLDSASIDGLAAEPRPFVRRLFEGYAASRRELNTARPGHVDDALRFARLAWRRPLSSGEEERLRSFYRGMRAEEKLDHAPAIRALLARILVAPAFLYRVESPPDRAGIVPLSDWALASRLSYFLWSSPPDAELRAAAAAGLLRDEKQLALQARRMVRAPKARRFATEFFGQWFGFYRFDGYRGVDAERFTEYTDALKTAMYDEAVSFFEHIVRADRPVREILFADYAFLNDELARHYGIDSEVALSDRPTLVKGVDKFHRGGLLRLGAVLTVTSAPLRTSAVKRGDWVLRRVLGTPVPPPPADVGSISADDAIADGKTIREQLIAHRQDATCVNCHSRIDPLGFALEHFDAIGRWRDRYRDGKPIDPTGTLNDGTRIEGPAGLRGYLRRQEKQFHRTLCTKLLGYALGRSELLTDRRLIDGMMGDLETDGRLSDLVVRIVTSSQFRHQRGRAENEHRTNAPGNVPQEGLEYDNR